MAVLIALLALVLLIAAAYRGFSVIIFAPLAAMLAVLLTDPETVPIMFTGVFMDRMVNFLKLYLPVFLLGALLAGVNTASEFGFGAVIAALPGFVAVRTALGHITDPLAQVAITVTTLAGMTGSASGGLSIALGAMADDFMRMASAHGIPLEVVHRIASMASGGMDTPPHNGAIITLLTVTGLTHRQSYLPILGITVIKLAAVAVVIAFYYWTSLY